MCDIGYLARMPAIFAKEIFAPKKTVRSRVVTAMPISQKLTSYVSRDV